MASLYALALKNKAEPPDHKARTRVHGVLWDLLILLNLKNRNIYYIIKKV